MSVIKKEVLGLAAAKAAAKAAARAARARVPAGSAIILTVKFHCIGFGDSGEGLDCSMHVFFAWSHFSLFGELSGDVFYSFCYLRNQ